MACLSPHLRPVHEPPSLLAQPKFRTNVGGLSFTAEVKDTSGCRDRKYASSAGSHPNLPRSVKNASSHQSPFPPPPNHG
jgi:hypothetical protein